MLAPHEGELPQQAQDRLSTVALLESLLEMLEAAGGERGITYVSVPITSGRREFELMRRLGVSDRTALRTEHRDAWLKEVVEPNESDAKIFADQARATFSDLVVDPSRVHVAHWTQDDFDKLWMTLIQNYAKRLVASPGWEFSRGAREEVALALALGLPIADSLGHDLAKKSLKEQALAAEQELRADGWAEEAIRAYLPPVVPGETRRHGHAERYPDPTAAAAEVFAWLVAERRYQLRKFGTALDDEHTREGLELDGWWWQQLTNYFGRARLLTLDTPGGRQALAKFVATGCGLLESAVRLYGPLPKPGVSSGEIVLDPTGPPA